MKQGDTMRSPIFGVITIDEVYDSEGAARAAGYYYDAHVHDAAWKYKVLAGNVEFTPAGGRRRFAACYVGGRDERSDV